MMPDARMNDRVALSMIGLVSSGVVLALAFLLVGRQPPMGAVGAVSVLPLVNACLNGASALLLTVGYGWIRGVYYPLLLSHLVLAALIVPLALTTLYRAWRGQFARHRRIARWTLPVWLYVSVT